jgi:hypothetical protein
MTDRQKLIFLMMWARRFPYTDISANLVKHINEGAIYEYLRRFKDIYPERCQLIKDVFNKSHELSVGDIG